MAGFSADGPYRVKLPGIKVEAWGEVEGVAFARAIR